MKTRTIVGFESAAGPRGAATAQRAQARREAELAWARKMAALEAIHKQILPQVNAMRAALD